MSNALDDGELVDCISFFPLVVRGAGWLQEVELDAVIAPAVLGCAG